MICKHGDYHITDIVLFTVVLVVIYIALLEHRWPKILSINILPVKKLYYTIIALIVTLQKV